MACVVKLTARAQRDLHHLYRHINAKDSEAALKWYRGFKDAILSLEEQPNRCPLTPESKKIQALTIWRQAAHLPRDLSGARESETS